MSKRPIAIIALLFAAVALPSGASPTASQSPPVSLVSMEPSDGAEVYVERLAADSQGASETWFLSIDARLQNTGSQNLRLRTVELTYPGSSVTKTTIPFRTLDRRQWIRPGERKTFRLVDTRRLPVPGPANLEASFTFVGSDSPFVVKRALAEFKTKAPGGYLFPARQEDLEDGEYWLDDETHFPGSGHYGSESQRFAYDLKVFRWDATAKRWTFLHEGKNGSANEDYVVWNVPVYAMADGWVLFCRRGIDDNQIGSSGTAGGNGYRIVHANGETAIYAHLKKGTVKSSLCPRSGATYKANAIRVKAGQELGRVGNSGQSSNPHLHIHIATGDGSGQGRPIHFKRIRTLTAGAGLKTSAPCAASTQAFVTTNGAAPAPGQLIDPLLLPGYREYARHGIDDTCAQELFSAYAAAGYSIAWLDGFDAGGKTYFNVVFRPGGPAWRYRFGLTAPQFQTQLEQAVRDGYRPTHVESYLRGGGIRFAFVAEKRSGPAYRVYHGLSATQHARLFDEMKAAGLRPVNIAVVSVNGSLRYTGFWEKRNLGAWKAASKVRSADYQRWLETEAKAGRRLVYLDAYVDRGVAKFSAVVSSAASAKYAARHGLTSQQYQAEYVKRVREGLGIRVVTGYVEGGQVRYAALWR